MIYLWGLIAGTLAVGMEASFKQSTTYWETMWWTVPGSIVVNFAVYQMVQLSPSLPSAFIVFGMTTMLCRTAVSLYQQHPITTIMWVAIGLYFMALCLRELERHL